MASMSSYLRNVPARRRHPLMRGGRQIAGLHARAGCLTSSAMAEELETGDWRLSLMEQRVYAAAAASLEDFGFAPINLAQPVTLSVYVAIFLRHAVISGDDETVRWASDRLDAEQKARSRPNCLFRDLAWPTISPWCR